MIENLSSNSSTDTFYNISIDTNSTEDNIANRMMQIRVANPRTCLTSNNKTIVIVALFFGLLVCVVYNYYYELVKGLNKTIS